MRRGTLWVTGSPECDRRVNTDPLALAIALLLDQQVSIELAFTGPFRLAERLGADPKTALDANAIAAVNPHVFTAIVAAKPALHRYPSSMARRIQALCSFVAERYGGDTEAIWRRRRSAEDVYDRLMELPGYGDEKSRIMLAVLAKRFQRRPADWQRVCAPFGDDKPRSVADMGDRDGRDAVRAWRREQKAQGKSKSD